MPAPTDPLHLPQRRLIAAVFGICLAFGLLRAAHFAWILMASGGHPSTPTSVLVGMRVLEWLTWAPLVLVVMAVARRVPLTGARWGRAVLVHVGLFVVLQPLRALATLLLGTVWPALAGPHSFGVLLSDTDFPRMVFGLAFPDFTVYCMILAAVTALDAYGRQMHQREALVRAERVATEARLHALEGQLNPHFLFNALNAISAYVERDPAFARRLMADLAGVLRFTLDHARGEEVALADECAVLERYLDLERGRYRDQITATVDVAPETLGLRVPALLLQPLVENAIRHGLRARLGAGRVAVSARRDGDRLMLRVDDDGVGLPEGWRLDGPQGVGLTNTAERLALLYGDAHTLHVGPRPGGGTRVEVTVPAVPAPASEGGRRVRQMVGATERVMPSGRVS